MRRLVALAAVLTMVAAVSAMFASLAAQAQPPAGGPPRGGQGMRPPEAAPDSFAAQRDSIVEAELQRIAGRENVAAESVYKNVQLMKGMPAGRMLRIMNMGYSRALGVGCDFCHAKNDWASDDKAAKKVARDMMLMTRAINDTLLPRVHNPENERRVVNCSTCHRGQKHPGGMGGGPRPGGPGAPGGQQRPGAPSGLGAGH